MKFIARAILSLVPLTLLVGSLGCNRKIGPPNDQEELMRPEDVVSFDRLYKQNCSACHGENGSGGPRSVWPIPTIKHLWMAPPLSAGSTLAIPGPRLPASVSRQAGFLSPHKL